MLRQKLFIIEDYTTMSLIIKLPKYIWKGFAQEWLVSTEIVSLDTAVCSQRDREVFLSKLSNMSIITLATEMHIYRCCLWMNSRSCFVSEFIIFPSKSYKKSRNTPQVSESLSQIFSKLTRIDYCGRECDALFYVLMFSLPNCREIKLRYINEDAMYVSGSQLPVNLKKLSLCGVVTCTSMWLLDLLFTGAPLKLEELCIEEDPNEYTMFGTEVFEFLLPITGETLTSLTIMGVHDEFHSILSLLEVHCPALSSLTIKAKSIHNDDWNIDPTLLVPSVEHLALCLTDVTSSNLAHFPGVGSLKLLRQARGRMQLRGATKSMISGLLDVLVSSPITMLDLQDIWMDPEAMSEITTLIERLHRKCVVKYALIG